MNDPKNPHPAAWDRGVDGGLYRLLTWLSPGFPIGAFSFSHALEAAVESGVICERASLENWIRAIVVRGSGRIDGDILCGAHRAAVAGDIEALVLANRSGIAFRATAEMAIETAAQGTAFLDTCRSAWREPLLERWAAMIDGEPVCYAAAVGAATARAGSLWNGH
jgi:urease accessory protein